MRRTVRPFVKEFKNRSSKSSTRQPAPAAEDREPKPSFFDLGDVAPRQNVAPRHNGHDDGYEAALKAADAIFGKKADAPPPIIHPALAEHAQPPAPAGRVLPSLIETEETVTARREPVKKARKPRAPRPEEAEKPATPARRGRPPRQPKIEEPSRPVERPAVKVAAQPPKLSTPPRRTRRSIQLRWVLQTELKAGEKWKRRLPEPAR